MDFVSNIANRTLTSISSLKFWYNNAYSQIEFVIIAQDDTYINIPLLWKYLYREKGVKKVNIQIDSKSYDCLSTKTTVNLKGHVSMN